MNRFTYPSIHRQSGHCLTLHSISENCMRISFATGTVMKHDNGMYKDSKSCKVQMYWKGFHVVVPASTLLYCCSLIFWVIPVAVLMVRNIVPYLVITCKAYDVFMLLLCLTTEIPAVTDVLKGISCGWTCFNTAVLLFFDILSNSAGRLAFYTAPRATIYCSIRVLYLQQLKNAPTEISRCTYHIQ